MKNINYQMKDILRDIRALVESGMDLDDVCGQICNKYDLWDEVDDSTMPGFVARGYGVWLEILVQKHIDERDEVPPEEEDPITLVRLNDADRFSSIEGCDIIRFVPTVEDRDTIDRGELLTYNQFRDRKAETFAIEDLLRMRDLFSNLDLTYWDANGSKEQTDLMKEICQLDIWGSDDE